MFVVHEIQYSNKGPTWARIEHMRFNTLMKYMGLQQSKAPNIKIYYKNRTDKFDKDK